MTHLSRSIVSSLAAGLVLAPLLATAWAAAPAAVAQEPPAPTVYTLLGEGVQLLGQRRSAEAAERFREAFRLSGDTSAEASSWEAVAWVRAGQSGKAEKAARRALELAGTPEVQVRAFNALGLALMAGSAKDKHLEEAAEAFTEALERSGGTYNSARFNLGKVLLRLERDQEGVRVLGEYLQHAPTEAVAREARSLIEDPRRARESIVPPFTVETLEGEVLSDRSLRGRVVLLDFWATWCGPCRQAMPDLESLHRRMDEEHFALVSISGDQQREVLEDFLEDHEVAGYQAWDGGSELRTLFAVGGFPTYVLVGAEGRVLYQTSGWSSRISRTLSSEVRRAVKRAKKR